jgi:hypothetical protein
VRITSKGSVGPHSEQKQASAWKNVRIRRREASERGIERLRARDALPRVRDLEVRKSVEPFLATPILGWPIHDPDGEGGNEPYRDIPAIGMTTTLLAVPGDGPKRFFAVVGKDAQPEE